MGSTLQSSQPLGISSQCIHALIDALSRSGAQFRNECAGEVALQYNANHEVQFRMHPTITSVHWQSSGAPISLL